MKDQQPIAKSDTINILLIAGVTAAVIAICGILALVIFFGGLFFARNQNSNVVSERNFTITQDLTATPTSTPTNESIEVYSIKLGDTITNPEFIEGEVNGSWFFEGIFAIEIQSLDGKVLGQGHAYSTEDWMTSSTIPFFASINFDIQSFKAGKIVFKKSNPSGLAQNDEVFEIPVKFAD